MSHLRFNTHQLKQNTLLLTGANYTGQISLLEQDIWRVLVSHRPEDQNKSSWIIQAENCLSPREFALRTEENKLLLQGNAPLQLSLKPFEMEWQGLKTHGLYSEAVQSRFQQVKTTESEENLHLSHQHPVRDKLDGLPQGSGLTLDFEMLAQDHFYGLGERTGFLNKRGRLWHNWCTDQFFHTPNADPLYQSHPFVIVARGQEYLGLYLDESWYSCFDLGFTHPDQWSIHTAGPTFDMYLIPGPSPSEILKRYTQLVGKASMPPLWALGQHQCRWSYPEQDVVQAVADSYANHDLPLDTLWLDIDYMESYKVFSFSSHRFKNPSGLIEQLNRSGIKTIVIVDPGVKKEMGYAIYESGKAIDAFIHNERDEELIGEVWPSPVVWPDFTQEQVRSWWGKQHQFYLDLGIAGIWNDMNEPASFNWPSKTLPLYARQGSYSHAEVHNLYAYHMAQATYEGLKELAPEQRPFVLTRAGCAGIQKYAWVWTGDNASYWEHMEMSLPMLLNLGLSGLPFIGADIGGFSGDCDGELLTAWTWLGVCYPLMRNHAGKRSRRQEPWQFGEPWLSRIRKALKFRYRLLPYLYTQCWFATENGEPLMRPLLLDYPSDPEVLQISDQFLLGKDLLVAPILRPGQTRRMIYMPRGVWFDFWTGQRYSGSQWHSIKVTLEQLPLYQRGGSAIPLQAPEKHTTTADWPTLTWQICPGDQICGSLYSDSGNGAVDGELIFMQGSFDGTILKLKQETQNRQNHLKLMGFGKDTLELAFSTEELEHPL